MTTNEFESRIAPCQACREQGEADTRVVLVKPGDLLLIGNVGSVGDPDRARSAVNVFKDMGINVVFFMDDIDMAKVHSHA